LLRGAARSWWPLGITPSGWRRVTLPQVRLMARRRPMASPWTTRTEWVSARVELEVDQRFGGRTAVTLGLGRPLAGTGRGR